MSFSAMYAGVCEAGDDPIRPGEQIVSDGDGGYSHLRCVQITDEPSARRAKPEVPCTRCRLVHAGECF